MVIKSKNILFGAWVGEFGWELFNWQGYVRHICEINDFDNVVIGTRASNCFLYQDFATSFITHENSYQKANQIYSGDKNVNNEFINKYKNFCIGIF